MGNWWAGLEVPEAWAEHCRVAHPSPVWAQWDEAGTQLVERAPSRCEVCAQLAPAEEIIAWHHTSPQAAEQIEKSGALHGRNGWAYFTSWRTREYGEPGVMACGRGAVIEAIQRPRDPLPAPWSIFGELRTQ